MATTGVGNKSGTPFFNPDGNKGDPMMNKLMIVLCLVFTSVANAEFVEVQFGGTIDMVSGGWLESHLNDSVYVGVPFSGSFSYDSGMIEEDPGNENSSSYLIPVGGGYSFVIEIGDYRFREESEYDISIGNDHPTYGDGCQVDMENLVVDGPPLPPAPLQDRWSFSHVKLGDRTGTALSSDQLPLEFPELDAWTHKAVITLSPGPINQINGTITRLTIVPEPASLALLALGGLAVVRRR